MLSGKIGDSDLVSIQESTRRKRGRKEAEAEVWKSDSQEVQEIEERVIRDRHQENRTNR